MPRTLSSTTIMTSPNPKQPQSWWRRNSTFPESSSSPMHAPRPSSCVCPCASCFNNTPRPQSYLHPRRPKTSISSTSATLNSPRTVVTKSAKHSMTRPPRNPTSSWEIKRSSIFSPRLLLRKRASNDTLASDFVPLRAGDQASCSRRTSSDSQRR